LAALARAAEHRIALNRADGLVRNNPFSCGGVAGEGSRRTTSVVMMKAVFPAMAIWLLLALVSVACVLLAGSQDHRNAYWVFTMGCWFVLDIYWALAARRIKPSVAGGKPRAPLLVAFVIYALYCLPLSSVPLLGERIVPHSVPLQALGALMCAFGVGFAIWSRRILAESWNAAVTRGENHSLVQRGPYAIVRHPIYFGLVIAVVGMVLALGEVRAVALLLGVEILLRKMGQEEQILRTAFPTEYPEYEYNVKRLLPWIW
jgi:protein-S-isoprenylcysteine O-methyltransferase Ste14